MPQLRSPYGIRTAHLLRLKSPDSYARTTTLLSTPHGTHAVRKMCCARDNHSLSVWYIKDIIK